MPYVIPTNVTGINLRKETPASRPDVFEGTDVWVAEVRAGASLSFLRESQNLRSLRIQDAEQLTGLEQLTQIDTLYLQHFPKVASLQSLATLLQLRKLYLSRNPSWDGTRKGLEVESFSPLAGLRELSDLTILGVSPRDRSLTPLYALARLRYVHVAWIDGLRMEDYAALSRNLPHAVGSCLQPCYTYNFPTFCKRCRQRTVFLTGARPRSRRAICPACSREHLDKHVQAWNAAGGRLFVTPKSASEVDIEQPTGADG